MTSRGAAVVTSLVLALSVASSKAAEVQASDPQEEDGVVLGTRSAFGATTSEDRIWAEAGISLLQHPSLQAELVDVLPTRIELDVLERRGDWVAVRYRSMKVWLTLEEQPEAVLFELPVPPDPDRRLREARAKLGGGERVRPLGPFTLYTDVENDPLLEYLAVAAADLSRAYAERYGLEPRLSGNEAVVLYRESDDYRRHEGVSPELAGLESHGHAGATIALLSVGDRGSEGVRRLLLHELTHLLNRGALARELPPWLEEGLAEDLSYLDLDEHGQLDPDRLGGRGAFTRGLRGRDLASAQFREVVGTNAWGSSPRAGLAWLLHSWKSRDRPSVDDLIDLPWTAFVDPGCREFHYVQSGFLIRYLLDDPRGMAMKLKAYLADVAAGEAPTGELFWSRLETQPPPPRRGLLHLASRRSERLRRAQAGRLRAGRSAASRTR